jgi:hypothetical protein
LLFNGHFDPGGGAFLCCNFRLYDE